MGDGRHPPPPSLPLDLHYLMTAWAKDAGTQQRLLGWAVRVMHDTATLPAGVLNAFGPEPVFRPDETVEVVWETLTQQDAYDIWDVARPNQQPSAAYVARIVEIDSAVAVADGPLVQTRTFQAERGVGVSADVINLVTPVGLRLWDVATGSAAADGVVVGYFPASGRSVLAVRTPSGVHALRGLPGLGAVERGTGDAAFWYHPPAGGSYRVDIRDPRDRYLPMCLDVMLPAFGLYVPDSSLPGLPASVVPVFSSPARPVPAGFAVVRAQLALGPDAPASWARLDIGLPDGTTATGVADGAGRVCVLFPCPEPAVNHPGDLRSQTWTLRLRAFFGSPAAAGRVLSPVAPADGVPELSDLVQQRPARLIAGDSGELTQAELSYGRELVLRTAGRSTLSLTGSS